MTYHELEAKAKDVYEHSDASEVRGHLAVQFNVTGEGEGAFYIEITDGVVEVMPYEYYDRDAIIYIPGPVLYDILDGKISFEHAYNELMLGIEGDLGAALLLKQVRLKLKERRMAQQAEEDKKAEQENPKMDEAGEAEEAKVEETVKEKQEVAVETAVAEE